MYVYTDRMIIVLWASNSSTSLMCYSNTAKGQFPYMSMYWLVQMATAVILSIIEESVKLC